METTRKPLGLVVVAFLLSPAALAADAEPVAQQRRPIISDDTIWRIFITYRKPLVREADGTLKEKNLRKWSGDAWTSGIETPLPPANWASPDFNDSAWLRYRRFTDLTLLPIKHLICMRAGFTVTDPSEVGEVTLTVAYRGGVVVYLNGTEIARGHVPEKEKGLEALAEDYPDEVYETEDGKSLLEDQASLKDPQKLARIEKRIRRLSDVPVPAKLLRRGENVLALELHRAPMAAKGDKLRNWPWGGFTWNPIQLEGVALTAVGSGVVPNAGRPKGVHIWAKCPDERVYLHWRGDYGRPNDPTANVVRVRGARNGAFSALIGVSSDEAIRGLKAEVSELTGPGVIPAKSVQVRYPVPDGHGGGMRDHHHTWDKTFDTLEETPPAELEVPKAPYNGLTKGEFDPTGITWPIWLTFNVPKDAQAGEYKGTVTVQVDGAPALKMPITLTVADWTLPDPKDFQTEMGLFESPESVAMKYKVDLWSDKHWELLDRVFRYMGMVGTKHVYLLLQRRLHYGNEQSMVRWIRKPGGGYTHDFTIVEKHLDLAVKHLGKPPVVCLVAWDFSSGWYGVESERQKGMGKPLHGARFTIYDPQTGKTEDGEGPEFGTPEAIEFWKPVYDGIAKILKARGLENSMTHGVFGDRIASPECFHDLRKIAPGVKWVQQNHPGPRQEVFGIKREDWLAAEAHVYIGLYVPNPDDPKLKRRYGWQAQYRSAWFPRGLFNNTTPANWHTVIEALSIKGRMGIARSAFDFWDVLAAPAPGSGEFGGRHLPNRFPENNWMQTSVTVAAKWWVSPGKEGPLSTVRLEMMRAGLQEAEARILIEKALVDPEKRARLGDELANRCQRLLDDRQRHLSLAWEDSFWAFNGRWWEDSTGELYRLAGEVAKKLGN